MKKRSKYFIGNQNKAEVKPLCILLPIVSRYVKNFDGAKTMSFFMKDEKLLAKHNKV